MKDPNIGSCEPTNHLGGITPRYVIDAGRATEIADGIMRYVNNGLAIPAEWIRELIDILAREERRLRKTKTNCDELNSLAEIQACLYRSVAIRR